METRVTSSAREVIIGEGRPTVLIGERINPSGKKGLAEALKSGNMDIVIREALAQVQAGADILDINVNTFGVDEVSLLPAVVQAVMAATDVPLCLDSSHAEALGAALAVYRGKPIVNSVTGEERSLSRVLPLVKQYGAAVIGLVQDDEGIPRNAGRRVTIARKIIERAGANGIPREDIIIDCLSLSAGSDFAAGASILESARLIKSELGVNTVVAASNISFGLPERDLLNAAYVAMAMTAGVSCFIADVKKVRPAVLAADLILGRDKYAKHFITDYRERHRQGQSP